MVGAALGQRITHAVFVDAVEKMFRSLNESRARARTASERKALRYAQRNAELFQRYSTLFDENLRAMLTEKAARALAVQKLAREENVKPQRMRDILRAKRGEVAHHVNVRR